MRTETTWASRALPAALFALTVAVCVWVYQPRLAPITLDNQTFFYIAERAASGVPPHVSVVNHKQALSHLLSGAAIYVGRIYGVDDVMAGRALSIFACAALVALTAVLGKLLTRSTNVAAFAGLLMLVYMQLLRQAVMGFRPHLYATLFMVAALVAYARNRERTAGACATAAFLCWQPAVGAAMGIAAASLTDAFPRRSLVRLAAGALLVVVPYEAYFIATGALGAQIYQSWTMASYGALDKVPGFRETVRFLLASDMNGRWGGNILPYSFFAGLLGLAAWVALRPRESLAVWTERRDIRAAAFTLAATLVLTFLNHQSFPDKFTLLPLMAILAGTALTVIVSLLGEGDLRYARTAPAVLAAVLVLGMLAAGVSSRRSEDSLGRQRAIAERIRSSDPGTPSVWAVGCLHLLAFNRQTNYASVGALFDARVRRAIGPDYRPLRDGRMPRIILLSRLGKKNRFDWFTSEYKELTPPEFDDQNVHVWVRNAEHGGNIAAGVPGNAAGDAAERSDG